MLKMWLESLTQNILKTPLRVCRVCGLEAWTEEDLKLFRKSRVHLYGYRNQCKKRSSKYAKKLSARAMELKENE